MSPTVPFAALPIGQRDVSYEYGPDSAIRPDVPAGTIEELHLGSSERYPGTSRKVWVHRPAGHLADAASAVMVFNDGWWYLDPDGAVRGGTVLDNLAADGVLPQMIGVFVDPGVVNVDGVPTKHRNAEYDAFDDTYASFLLEEVLPEVESRYGVSAEPMNRGICGGSSGGNAALTAAWTRPDGFGRVIAFNPSFAQMPGGNPYPELLAAEAPRPTRVFLHAAHRDLHWNERAWNWFAESLDTASALARAGYDFRLVVGDGSHSPNHGGVLLPDALRWLWAEDHTDA
ncbi:alpha/beta hydrolase [Curtobacterium herbarum]|uniref:Alpha/beta hydrolase-fold protein n=1 Tax=Curtobacterium herbarum TaxID=150122 RepID=A0ABN1ZFC8_9MICO|nr:alpha/beta hydrolase-fold protein [Curtobacterium herbarum]MBM7474473.1 enterochelin esterase family protein [Curtobacterium herbarum]MCS6545858.1 alpha/beta hydrolase-fold protein [Curtobacterium herbarum]